MRFASSTYPPHTLIVVDVGLQFSIDKCNEIFVLFAQVHGWYSGVKVVVHKHECSEKKSSLYSHSVKENDSIHDIEIVFRSIRVLACTSAQNQGAIMDFCEICPTIQLFSHKPLFKKITKKNCPRNRKEKVAVCFPDVRGKNLTNASLT